MTGANASGRAGGLPGSTGRLPGSAGGLHRMMRVARVVHENPRTVSLVTDAPLDAGPGQFVMLWLPGLDEKPFSIAGRNPLTVTVSRVGPFSEALHGLEAGDPIWVRGPFGRGFPLRDKRAVLVGGGYGAAPLLFLARALAESEAPAARRPFIALGAKNAEDLLFPDRFQAMDLPVHLATEDGSRGVRGRVTEVVKPLLESGEAGHLYACGPEGMLEALAGLCREAGITADLSFEAYMRCGVGVCGACQHGPRLICLDGPVLSFTTAGEYAARTEPAS